jgi:hypothetical protein
MLLAIIMAGTLALLWMDDCFRAMRHRCASRIPKGLR